MRLVRVVCSKCQLATHKSSITNLQHAKITTLIYQQTRITKITIWNKTGNYNFIEVHLILNSIQSPFACKIKCEIFFFQLIFKKNFFCRLTWQCPLIERHDYQHRPSQYRHHLHSQFHNYHLWSLLKNVQIACKKIFKSKLCREAIVLVLTIFKCRFLLLDFMRIM